MNHDLIKPVSNEEVKRAVFIIKGGSTAGADGMTAHVFHSYWEVVGERVKQEVKKTFEPGTFLPELNFTNYVFFQRRQTY